MPAIANSPHPSMLPNGGVPVNKYIYIKIYNYLIFRPAFPMIRYPILEALSG